LLIETSLIVGKRRKKLKKLIRVFHPVFNWEEIKYNMWGEVDDIETSLSEAIAFTSNHKLYGSWMNRVVNEWPISCENALTDNSLNRKAWVGHAAVAMATGIPEDITRMAWGFLSDEQRFLANEEARRAIMSWERDYRKHNEIYHDVEEPVLF
jgi:hypothetical protein